MTYDMRHFKFLNSMATRGIVVALALTTSIGAMAAASDASKAIAPVKDQRALDELKMMSQALAKAQSLSFSESSMTPIRGPNGQWLHIFKTAKVNMQRPNKLFVETGGDAFPQRIYFDGSHFSVSASEPKLYSQEEIAGSVEKMLAETAQKSGNAFTFSDVLLADPYSAWTKDLHGAVFVGNSVRGNESLHHLAFTEKDEDWEVWTDAKNHLPRMVFVKYLTAERSPSVLIEFSKWKLNEKIPASTFTFHAPAGAKRASLKVPGAGIGVNK